MQVILLQKVTNLGNLGDKVNVRSGYGRNFLIPQGKAVPASAENLAAFEARRAEYEAQAQNALHKAQQRAEQLAQLGSVTILAHASTEGKLYGSVGPRDIARALTDVGHRVSKSEVVLGEGAFRLVGTHTVTLHLHSDVDANITVHIQADPK